MKKNIFTSGFLSLICFTALVNADAPSSQTNSDEDISWCDNVPKSMRITSRHIENKGIGYNTGYTTLETFLAASPDKWCVMPFLDLRAHLFNNGKWAANGGVGLRNIMGDRVYGIYSYYDYRNTRKDSYNQVSFGLETLGTFWDARINGYVVLGSQKSKRYGMKFDRFSGNHLYYSERFEYALSGTNGEIGFHPIKMKNVDVYTAIGPYYLKGPSRGGVWGVETRATASWKDYVAAEVSYSYDHMFRNIVQGQVSLSYPFGPKSKVKASQGRSCKENKLLYRRMVQSVMKEEIIPVHTKKRTKKAINPETGDPYIVWFVDNLSHSDGTFQSPFSTLADAQNASGLNDIIYVFPGDNTSNGMSSGITLKSGQQLLGATISHTLPTTKGTIQVKAQASGPFMPLIEKKNTTGPVVTTSNNNTISGLYIMNTTGHGILASNVGNLMVNRNTIQSSTTSYSGIELDNVEGSVMVNQNRLLNQAACVNINNTLSVSNALYLFTNNYFGSAGGNYDVDISHVAGSDNSFVFLNNQFFGGNTEAINMALTSASVGSPNFVEITNNSFNSYGYPFNFVLNGYGNCDLTMTDNTIFTPSSYGASIVANNNSNLTGNIKGNVMASNEYTIFLGNFNSSTCNVNIQNNTLNSPYYTVYLDSSGTSYTGQITGNTIYATDNDELFFWNIGGACAVSATVAGNFFSGGYYVLDIENNSTGTSNIMVANNEVQSTAAPALYLHNNALNQYTLTVENNTLTGTGIGNAVQVVNDAGNTCLQFNNNTSEAWPNAFSFTVAGGNLYVVTPTGNQGQIVQSGTTPVTTCP